MVTMIPDYRDIAEFIINNYRNKVIEVGVGSLPHVALLLKSKLEVIITDVNEQKYDGIMFFRDDVFKPDLRIYQNASLIYSIRPPVDIQDAVAKIACEVGADLLIRPFGNEKADIGKYFKEYSIVNYKSARFSLGRGLPVRKIS